MRLLFLILLCIPSAVTATEYRPWYGEDKLIEIRPAYMYQYSPHVDVDGKTISRYSHNHMAQLSISAATDCTWAAEGEIYTAATSFQGYSLEALRGTVRYRPYNDCVGDPLSITTGLSITQVTTPGRRDLYTLHQGQMEYEIHIAAGKEAICRQFWTSRGWGMLGAGIANRGSPWLHGLIGYDINHWDCYHYGFFLEGYCGFGQHKLCLTRTFQGYGAIKYRTLDLHLYFTKGMFSIEYLLRPWSYNSPTHSQAVQFTLTIPYAL